MTAVGARQTAAPGGAFKHRLEEGTLAGHEDTQVWAPGLGQGRPPEGAYPRAGALSLWMVPVGTAGWHLPGTFRAW